VSHLDHFQKERRKEDKREAFTNVDAKAVALSGIQRSWKKCHPPYTVPADPWDTGDEGKNQEKKSI